ncbi:MAG: GNAT family N-acetyltransferase [Steroidobacteraceae bacterium]
MAPALRGPDGPRCNPLLHLGCKDISGQTWIADLRGGVDAAWRRFEGRVRTNVRRAQEAGVRVRPSAGESDWSAFFDLHRATYRRLGVAEYPSDLFRVIFGRLIPAGLCYVQFAEHNGELIAAQNIACYKHGGYYWHGFATEAGLRLNAMTLLCWENLRVLATTGTLEWIDLGDAILDKHEGKLHQLSEFKRGFGGMLYPAFRGQFDGTSKLYNRLRHLRGLISGR